MRQPALRDLASNRALADQTAASAEARYVEPDEAYFARLRPHHETNVQVSGLPGSWDCRYPAYLTEPGAGAYSASPPRAVRSACCTAGSIR